jgi:hypothetical protein
MDKPKLNFVIDALMFLCLMALAGLGFLMKYPLPSGRDAWARYGSNLQFSWLGLDRHDMDLHWRPIMSLFRSWCPTPGGGTGSP